MTAMKATKAKTCMKRQRQNGKKKCRCAHCVRKMVMKGQLEVTSGGLTISDLVKNRKGRIVSKQRMHAGKRNYPKSALFLWNTAMVEARSFLEINGWASLKKNTPAYRETKKIYEEKLMAAFHTKVCSNHSLMWNF